MQLFIRIKSRSAAVTAPATRTTMTTRCQATIDVPDGAPQSKKKTNLLKHKAAVQRLPLRALLPHLPGSDGQIDLRGFGRFTPLELPVFVSSQAHDSGCCLRSIKLLFQVSTVADSSVQSGFVAIRVAVTHALVAVEALLRDSQSPLQLMLLRLPSTPSWRLPCCYTERNTSCYCCLMPVLAITVAIAGSSLPRGFTSCGSYQPKLSDRKTRTPLDLRLSARLAIAAIT